MSIGVKLGPEVESLATAIGLLKPGAGGVSLDSGFFSDPWSRVSRIISDETQRAALINALEQLLTPEDSLLLDAADSPGAIRRTYPLLEKGKPGQVFLVVERDGPAAGAAMRLGAAAEAQAANGGPSALIELTLLAAQGGSVKPAAATKEYPLRIEARAPLGINNAAIAASVLVVAPPDEKQSRVSVRVEGLADGAPPIHFDISGAEPPLAKIAIALMELALAAVGGNAPPEVQRIATALPPLLGLDGGLPPLPLGDLVGDASALRGWLAALATTTAADGRAALAVWIEAIGRLLGADPLPAPAPAGTEDDPIEIALLKPVGGNPGIFITAGVRADAASGTRVLVIGMRVDLVSAAVDATVRGEAVLLTVPLSGAAPTSVLERLDVRVDSPASNRALLDENDTGGSLGVGALRAGLRYRSTADGPKVVPLLELHRVKVRMGGRTTEFDRLDLTDVGTFTAAAEQVLDTALSDGLGAGWHVAEALRMLIGLGTNPGLDLALAASAPARAIAAYYRALRATADGWTPVLRALSRLLGSAQTTAFEGTGTADDPWLIDLDAFPAPADAQLRLRLALWDEGDAVTPRLCLAFRAEGEGANWDLWADAQLLAVDLPDGGGGDARWISGVSISGRIQPAAASLAAGGLTISTGAVLAKVAWTPGQPLRIGANITNVSVDADGEKVQLGNIALPWPAQIDLTRPDLGLGLDPSVLWEAARLLLSRCAGSWGGPAARSLLALIGVAAPATPGLPVKLPPLAPPTVGDLASLAREPLEAVRKWLAAMLADEVASITEDGVPFVSPLLDIVQALLTNRLAPLPGQDLAAPDVPLYGHGRLDAPWAVPLQPSTGAPVELLLWLEPDGPPGNWPGALLDRLLAEAPSSSMTLLAAADALSGYRAEIAAALHGREPELAFGLGDLTQALISGDGLVPAEIAVPDAPGWDSGTPARAAHGSLPRAAEAVAQIRARIAQLTAGKAEDDWAVALLAPRFAAREPWAPLLSDVAPEKCAEVSLRAPGVAPARVDLGALPAALWYRVDLADDGAGTLQDATAALVNVIDAIRRVKSNAKIVLVAHSYLATTAMAYASAHTDAVLGLIALGAPLQEGDVVRLDSPGFADAVRFASAVLPGGVDNGGPIDDALTFLGGVLDGYDDRTAGVPPAASPFPLMAFGRGPAAAFDLHGLPALAIPGIVGRDLRTALAAGLAQSVALTAGETPTHLAWGIRIGLGLPSEKDGDPKVDATIRLELGRVNLERDAAPAEPQPLLEVRARIARPGGWLVGGPGSGDPLDARIRWAELTGSITYAGGMRRVAAGINLHDAALRGSAAPVISLTDPRSAELLNALVNTLDPPARGGRIDAILDFLAAVGVLRRATASAPAAVLADGIDALMKDPEARLASRLPALLDGKNGLFGLMAAPTAPASGGPWRFGADGLPVEMVVETAPWRITVQTTRAGLPLGATGTLQASGTVALSDLKTETTWSLEVGGVQLRRGQPAGPVVLTSGLLDEPLTLVPGDPDKIGPALAATLPRLLVSGALTALVEQSLGGGFLVGSLDGLLRNPGEWLSRAGGLGDGNLPRADRLRTVLPPLASLAGLPSNEDKPLQLPGGLFIDFADAGAAPDRRLQLHLKTGAPVKLWDVAGADATLALDLYLEIDRQRHVAPGGQATLHMPLPGDWGAIDIHAGADAAGLKFAVSTTSGVNLTLLPSVSGFETLVRAAGQQLLPEALDRLVTALNARNPRPAALDDVLAVVSALGIYDSGARVGEGFKSRAQQLATFEADIATGNLQHLAAAAATTAVTLLRRLLGVNVVTPPPAPGHVGIQLAGVLGGSIGLEADFSTAPVGVRVTAQQLDLGAVKTDISVGFANNAIAASAALTARIDTGVGLSLTPKLAAGLDFAAGPRLSAEFWPLGSNEVVIPLAPHPIPPTPTQLLKMAETWVVPLAGTLLLRACDGVLSKTLWNGAPKTIADLLVSAQVAARDAGGKLSLRTPLPGPPALLQGILDCLTGFDIPLPGGFKLSMVKDAGRYGLVLGGEQTFAAGDYSLALRLGLPQALDPGWGDAGKGVGFLLLDLANPQRPSVKPALRLGGIGLRLGRKEATSPLVNAGGFRLGAVSAYLRADVELTGAGAPNKSGGIYGAVELDGLGLTLGAGENSGNPVAGSLVQRDGTGDSAPANPPFDLLVASAPAGFTVRFGGQAELKIGVHRTFGPLHIEELGLLYRADHQGPGKVGVSIDGGVAIAGLVVQVEDFTLLIPLKHPDDLKEWSLDLGGLAVSFETSSVSISGGLLKATLPDGTIDYEGGLSVQVAGRGLSALGAYARPSDALGGYTSMFAFLAVSAPLGGPPYLFVTGAAGGAGYNRRLLTPRDPAAVPNFPLVKAMTGGGGDPMGMLSRIATDIPPSRGSFWIAGGVKFSTFEVLHTTALVTVALDRGLEVSILGLMQLALPAEGAAVVSLELALAAKYSTVDQVLSIRAALTNNSWLLSRDCQLTGGFAFVVWFSKPEVILSVGGYSSKFQKPSYYPDVPRVGFHWEVGGGVVVKGESFFAITHSAAMLGGALEASYNVSPIKVWFSATLDVILWWDPFHYAVDARISIGAEFRIQVCFIACATISVGVSLSASLRLEGPPLHGTVLVDLDVASVTIEFGAVQSQPYLTWDQVRVKYISGGVEAAAGTACSVVFGVLGVASKQPDGSEASPWVMAPEFKLRVEAKMPASGWRLGTGAAVQVPQGAPAAVDVVPANPSFGRVKGILNLSIDRKAGGAWVPLTAAELGSLDSAAALSRFPGAVWDGATSGQPGRAMLPALGAVELGAAINVTETTGKLGDIAFAKMVEEELPLPLPFPAAATTPAPARLRGKSQRRAAPGGAQSLAPAVAAPKLRITLPPPRLIREKLDSPSLRSAAVALPRGGAQVWDVAPEAMHELRLQDGGAPVRITALSGTGVVLADFVGAIGKVLAPEGACSVVVAETSAQDIVGWELATQLLHAAPGTLLAPGAVLYLPRPWTPPARFGRPGAMWAPASALPADFDGLQTFFAVPARARLSVLVRLDPRKAGADPATAQVEATGGVLGEPVLIQQGERVELVFPVERIDQGSKGISVTVRCGEDWRLAGVLCLRGEVDLWKNRLTAKPHLRLIGPAPEAPAKSPLPRVTLRPTTSRRIR